MSGIGHLSVGFAAKSSATRTPLWTLLLASEANDVLYFLFSTTGLEKNVAMTVDFTWGMRYLAPSSSPWSHGLIMSLVWAILAGFLAFLFFKERKTSLVMGIAVFSHWILDFLMHSNLHIFLDGSPLVGLGLENTGPGMIFMTVLDLVLLAAGVVIYFRSRKHPVILI